MPRTKMTRLPNRRLQLRELLKKYQKLELAAILWYESRESLMPQTTTKLGVSFNVYDTPAWINELIRAEAPLRNFMKDWMTAKELEKERKKQEELLEQENLTADN